MTLSSVVLRATAFGLLLVSAVVDAQILNSERIEQMFGSYGIDVVVSETSLRVSNLYSLDGDRKISRTYAVVATPSRVDPVIATLHAEILGGGSIGATFKAAGWDVLKRHLYFGRARLPVAVATAMGVAPEVRVAMHAYVLDVTREDARFEYATIIELHHPDYLQLKELIEIYAPDWHSAQEVPMEVRDMLIRAELMLERTPSALRE